MTSGIHYISFISPEQNTSGIKEEKHYEKQLIALLTMSALAVGTLAGCGNTAATDTAASAADTAAEPTVEAVSTAADEAADTSADKYADLSGSVSMSGSTSMEKLANAVAESFMEI